MKKLLAVMLLPVLTGCLSATVPNVSCWLVDYQPASSVRQTPVYGVVRVMPVKVRSPYNQQNLAVLRENGTVAFDPYNEYAALPAQLVKGAVMDALDASGCFADVIDATSSVAESHSIEVVVMRLALDCRRPDTRYAVADLTVRVLKDRAIVSTAKGAAEVDAADGNYGKAFSAAVSVAVRSALTTLK